MNLQDIKREIISIQLQINKKWTDFEEKNPKAVIYLKKGFWAGKWLTIVGFSALLILILTVRLGIYRPIPTFNEIRKIQNPIASEVYSADGVLLGKYYSENRTNASINDIPQHVIDALVATEDVRFYQHSGVDIKSLFRVFFKSLLLQKSSAGGGSTISQQLAKNIYGRKNIRFIGMPLNKTWEMIVARRLEKIYDKREILELYLNTVSFGEDVYGIETAAERYFNTNVENLRIEDGAVLVGMLKATTYYNPKAHPEHAKNRRNTVFEQMEKYDYLATELVDSLQSLSLELDYKYNTKSTGLAPYFREMLRLELEKTCSQLRNEDGEAYNLYTDGLKIYTTIDAKMQTYAERAVQTHMKDLQNTFFNHWKGRFPWGNDDASIRSAMKKTNRYRVLKDKGWSDENIEKHFKRPTEIAVFTYDSLEVKTISPWDSIIYYHEFLNTGFLAMNPKNGFVNAYVGGINHQYFQYDHVFSKRQVGSTFKPIVYAEALENGYSPCDYLPNEKFVYEEYQNWTPGNSDGKYGGYYSIKGGLTNSVNTIAVQLMMENGVSSVQMLAKKMGITSELPNVPSIALGTADISLYEMLQVYATFANRGKPIEPTYLLKIEDKRGKTLKKYAASTMKANVISEQTADYMVKMMESVVDSGTARRLRFRYGLNGSIAGKTGTTQNQTDGWFMGITPNLVAGVWVGGRDRSVRFRSTALGQGANMALPIWGLFMKAVYADENYKVIKQAYFPPLSDSLSIDCPLYVDYLTDIDFGDENLEMLEEEELIDLLDLENKNPIELSEEELERLQEIKRKQERRKEQEAKMTERERKREERREKSRKFFNKVKDLIKKD